MFGNLSGRALLLSLAPCLFQAQNLHQIGEWQQVKYTAKSSLLAREAHAGAFLSSTNEYLVFGGSDGSTWFNDLHSINITSMQSTLVSTNTTVASRVLMSFTSDFTSNFYVHGGSNGNGYRNDFWSYNVQTRLWNQLAIGPSTRRGHCMDFDNFRNQIILFGGWTGFSTLGDLWTYSISSNQWQQVTPAVNTSRPTPRVLHACTFNNYSGVFYVHGGRFEPKDLWQFNFTSNQWDLMDSPSENLDRWGHSIKYSNPLNSILCFMGTNFNIGTQNTIYQFSLNNRFAGWQLLHVNISQVPAGRYFFSSGFNPLNGNYFIFGGFNDVIQLYYNDFWKIQLETAPDSKTDNPISSTTTFLPTTISQTVSNSIDNSSFLNSVSEQESLNQVKSQTIPLEISTTSAPPSQNEPTARTETSTTAAPPSQNEPNARTETSTTSAPPSQNEPTARTETSTTSAPPSQNEPNARTETSTTSAPSSQNEPTARTETSTTSAPSSQNQLLPVDSNITFLQTFQNYIIAGGLSIILILIIIMWITRRRKRRAKQGQDGSEFSKDFSTRSTEEYSVSQGRNESNMSVSKENSTSTSSADHDSSSTSPYNQSSSTENSMATAVSNEVGLSVPGYLQVDFKKSVRINRILAQGGFGIVALADALESVLKQYGEKVVVKQFKNPNVSVRDIQLFYQEISLMEYFKDDRHIAKLLGYSTDPYCMVMKYYPMGSLTRVIKENRYRCKIRVLTFALDISKGLLAMHSKGVAHNDLKPDNVLVDTLPDTDQLFCVLSDLGISQVVTQQILMVGEFQLTEIRALSFAYAAPERLLFFRKKLTIGANDQHVIFSWDIYALGIVIFELLTGKTQMYGEQII